MSQIVSLVPLQQPILLSLPLRLPNLNLQVPLLFKTEKYWERDFAE